MKNFNMKKSEILEFKFQTTGEVINFPVGTIYGNKEGPTLVVLGGMHGSEFCGIQGAIDVFNQVNPEELTGTLIVGTIYNMSAFVNHTGFIVPQDGKNPMSTFPGKRNGTYGEVMAYHFNEEVLSRADYFIELHGGDIPEALTPFTIQTITENEELNSKIKDMAIAYNIPLIINAKPRSTDSPGSAFMKTIQRGIPAILTESGQQGILNLDDAKVHSTGILNVMKKIGMLSGEIVDTTKRINLEYNGAIRNEVKGMWYPNVKLNQIVEKDEIVGEIRDYFGKKMADIKSPIDGIITVVRTSPSVGVGNVLVELHKIMKE
ncbi:MAG: succinylglutamate desuccinylase/aspartoacylase family protein [Tissierellales bacterium]|nr:succinylglutamate desuccinylase/aspartoacylase family protein [Tissierellales bacterium]MBN2828119.1 succinylglutamate desuccinylase/aspartoacylase family protein [Tissierellales bacterium]